MMDFIRNGFLLMKVKKQLLKTECGISDDRTLGHNPKVETTLH